MKSSSPKRLPEPERSDLLGCLNEAKKILAKFKIYKPAVAKKLIMDAMLEVMEENNKIGRSEYGKLFYERLTQKCLVHIK
jgi:hypothetical protein